MSKSILTKTQYMNQPIYHYLIMAQKDLLKNQCLEEILRERTTYFLTRQKHRNFWITVSPKFLYSSTLFQNLKLTKFYQQNKFILSTSLGKDFSNNPFFISLISLDKEFINWIQLRLGYFENIENKPLVSENQQKDFVSNGVKGCLTFSSQNNLFNPLAGYSNYIDPDILMEKNRKFLELYYKMFHKNEFQKEVLMK